MLGAYNGLEEIVSHDTLLQKIRAAFASKEQFIEINCKAFLEGYRRAKEGESDA